MAEVNDEATNALIASMLAEDNHYTEYDAYMGPDSEDDDWGGSKKRSKKGTAGRKSKASRAAAAPDTEEEFKPDSKTSETQPQAGQEQELSATGRRKRKDTGTNRTQSRGWSDEEEKLFVEALELHGRDWKAAAAHVGTRDARAFTSHAQKYFIKLAIAGKPVPSKVAETGQGYTLSGKPLDPTSAAARAYGLKPDILNGLQKNGSAALAGFCPAPTGTDQAEKENCSAASEGANQQAAAAQVPPNKRQKRTPTDAKPPKPVSQPAAKAHATVQSSPDLAPPPEPTEYAKNRPRREVGRTAMSLGHTTESLELVKCCDFVGPPGSGAPLAQPFQVEVDAQVHLMMDFHAHLSSCEIIGLLGGQWDSDRKVISIRQAFPCRRAVGSHSGTSVELDPEAEVETRALMDAQGLTPVGWYHSHPIFAPKPSQKDNENQRNYQALFRCAKTQLEPFIGAIVGPYDMQLPTQASAFTWFVVQTKSGDLTPFSIRHTVKPMAAMPEEGTVQQLLDLASAVKDDYGRMDLSSMWRPYCSLRDCQPVGGPCSRLEKLNAALLVHLPKDADCCSARSKLFLDIAKHIQKMWHLPLGILDEATKVPDAPIEDANAAVADPPSVQTHSTALPTADSRVEESIPRADGVK